MFHLKSFVLFTSRDGLSQTFCCRFSDFYSLNALSIFSLGIEVGKHCQMFKLPETAAREDERSDWVESVLVSLVLKFFYIK